MRSTRSALRSVTTCSRKRSSSDRGPNTAPRAALTSGWHRMALRPTNTGHPSRVHVRARSYAALAAILSQGSPLGAFLLRTWVTGGSLAPEVGSHLLFYAYMSVATLVV